MKRFNRAYTYTLSPKHVSPNLPWYESISITYRDCSIVCIREKSRVPTRTVSSPDRWYYSVYGSGIWCYTCLDKTYRLEWWKCIVRSESVSHHITCIEITSAHYNIYTTIWHLRYNIQYNIYMYIYLYIYQYNMAHNKHKTIYLKILLFVM